VFLVDTGHGKLELSVFEDGVPPVFRIHAPKGQTLPDPASVTVETLRAGGAVTIFLFTQKNGFLESTTDIPEPHEFDAFLKLNHEGYDPRVFTFTGRMNVVALCYVVRIFVVT